MAERMPLRLADVRSGSVSVTGVPDLVYKFWADSLFLLPSLCGMGKVRKQLYRRQGRILFLKS